MLHPPPIFVLAPPRSCSTVCVAMLGCHKELYAFPELLAFTASSVGELLEPWKSGHGFERYHRSGIVRAVGEVLFGSQSPEDIRRAVNWLEGRAGLRCDLVFDELLASVAPRRGVEKSPDTTKSPIFLQRCREAYPDAYFLHLVRHPAASIASMLRAPQFMTSATLSDRVTIAANIWLRSHQTIQRFLEVVDRDHALRVRAEDLLNQPTPTLVEIAHWLGVDSGAVGIRAMQHPEDWPYAAFGPPAAPGGGDHLFFSSPVLRPIDVPAGLTLPERWQLDPKHRGAITELAASFGYAAEDSAAIVPGRTGRTGGALPERTPDDE